MKRVWPQSSNASYHKTYYNLFETPPFVDALKYGTFNATVYTELFDAASKCLGDNGKGCNCSKSDAQALLNKYIDYKSFWEGFLIISLTNNMDGATSPYPITNDFLSNWRNNFYTYSDHINKKLGFVSWDYTNTAVVGICTDKNVGGTCAPDFPHWYNLPGEYESGIC